MSNNQLNRRDFLKLLGLASATIAVKPLATIESSSGQPQPHMIVLVYDAWAARNTSLYGYPRTTMPHLEKYAERALVYHRHYSAGNFTVPGTASLLTGLYPWNHRAFSLGGRISNKYKENQIFNVFSGQYQTTGFAQNKYADLFLYQAGSSLQNHISNHEFNLERRLIYNLPFFNNDPYVAFSSFEDNIFQKGYGLDGSLFAGPIFRTWTIRERFINKTEYSGKYYNETLPDSTEQFLLSDTVDGAINILKSLDKPSLVYIHFFPPHDPYRPTYEFKDYFAKTPETLVKKPVHYLSDEKNSYGLLLSRNQTYDEYLATWDAEVSRLYQFIDQSGFRDKSYIFLTSDHGEMFERGEVSHMTPLLNQPIVHIPLVVSYPGIEKRKDIFSTTSAVDILPTLAHLSGIPKPEWAEGEVLPGLGGQDNKNRAVYSFEAKKNPSFAPLKKFSLSLTRENKRILFYQYNNKQSIELYDLDQDPEEINDLNSKAPEWGKELNQELLNKVSEITSSKGN